MLQEAIYKFKISAPLLLPELIENYRLDEEKNYEDYAYLRYSVSPPRALDDVLDMFEDKAELRILYHLIPSRQTAFGHSACAYSIPTGDRMFKINVKTDSDGLVNSLEVTIYDSLEEMQTDIRTDLYQQEKRGEFKCKLDYACLLNDFS